MIGGNGPINIAKEQDGSRGAIVVLWEDGRRAGTGYSLSGTIIESVRSAAMEADSEEDGDDADTIAHIHMIEDEMPGISGFEPGIHGLLIRYGEYTDVLYASYAIEGNYKLDKLMVKLCQRMSLEDGCHRRKDVKFSHFTERHIGRQRYGDGVIEFYRGKALIDRRDGLPDKAELEGFLNSSISWLVGELSEDGSFKYSYYPASGQYSTGNNPIRQLMASRVLAVLASEDNRYLDEHDKNLDKIFMDWYRKDLGVGFILFGGSSKLGSNAMALRTLIYSPRSKEYEDESLKLRDSIIRLQNDDGSFVPFLIEPDYPYDPDYLLTFYSGEAILALLEHHEKTGDEISLLAARRAQDFYMAEYVEKMDENYYPAYVPWHTMSMYKLYEITGEKSYLEGIIVLNDELLKIQDTDLEPYPDHQGRFYDPRHPEYGSPHSASDGIYTEGLVYAYLAALRLNDTEHATRYRDALGLALRNLIYLQVQPEDAYYMQHPERAVGAVKTTVSDSRLRIDNTQHAIDAVSKALEVLYAER